MGRYYSGDIEGKFWFGVQSSDDADYFGVIGQTPSYLEYYFDEDNLEDIERGINECLEVLGEYKDRLDKFFSENNYYNVEDLKEIGVEPPRLMLEVYARLQLGQEILECVKEQGSCTFEAEL